MELLHSSKELNKVTTRSILQQVTLASFLVTCNTDVEVTSKTKAQHWTLILADRLEWKTASQLINITGADLGYYIKLGDYICCELHWATPLTSLEVGGRFAHNRHVVWARPSTAMRVEMDVNKQAVAEHLKEAESTQSQSNLLWGDASWQHMGDIYSTPSISPVDTLLEFTNRSTQETHLGTPAPDKSPSKPVKPLDFCHLIRDKCTNQTTIGEVASYLNEILSYYRPAAHCEIHINKDAALLRTSKAGTKWEPIFCATTKTTAGDVTSHQVLFYVDFISIDSETPDKDSPRWVFYIHK